MDKNLIIEKNLSKLKRMSLERLIAVSDYIDFINHRYSKNDDTTEGIQLLAEKSGSFDFLEEEEDLYTLEDLKETFR